MSVKGSRIRRNLRRSMALQRLRRDLPKITATETTRKAKQPRREYVTAQIEILEKRVT